MIFVSLWESGWLGRHPILFSQLRRYFLQSISLIPRVYSVLFAIHTRWQNDIDIHCKILKYSLYILVIICASNHGFFKHFVCLLRFMRVFWICVSPCKCAFVRRFTQMVSHFSVFTLKADGNFELFFIFVMTTKLNLHQIIYLFERHCRFEESKLDNEFLTWVGGRLGVYLRFVRWERCQKSKECHSNCHRSWLFWTPLGQYALMLRQLLMAESNVGSNHNIFLHLFIWFAPNSINFGDFGFHHFKYERHIRF